MQNKLTVLRIISSVFIGRMIRLFSIIGLLLFCMLILITCALSYYLSGWWWLLLVPILLVTIVFVIIRTIALYFKRRVYSKNLTDTQKKVVNAFVDKLNALIEARAISRWMIVVISLKDLLRYGELRTIKQLINDSVSLKRDFEDVERSLRDDRLVIDQDS